MHTLPTREGEKSVWPQKLVDLMKGIGKIHTNPEGKMFIFTDYSDENGATGFDVREILVQEEVATAGGGCI